LPEFSHFPLAVVVAAFLTAALVIAIVGTRLAAIADELAVRTGLGEALVGAVLVGASTSLPGIVTSVVTAAQGHVGLATGNALGGIAAQTAFLAIADIVYRRANLEHAAASVGNLVQGSLLIVLLTIPLMAASLPPLAVYGVSPATVVLIIAYGFGLRLLRAAGVHPMWQPRRTKETQREETEVPGKVPGSTAALWVSFAVFAMILATMGFVVSQSGVSLATRTGLSESAVGALLTAVATSLPELVVAVAAVRQGALNLAVGNIIGGNCFDVLFLAGADIAYRDGSLYAGFVSEDRFLAIASVLMTGILLLGLLHRQRRGFARIGFESTLILAVYGIVLVVMAA
jgi:cation:H+ antiporter